MPVDTSPRSTTWTFVDGEWISGNPPLIGPTSHAMWLGSTVFDGARPYIDYDNAGAVANRRYQQRKSITDLSY